VRTTLESVTASKNVIIIIIIHHGCLVSKIIVDGRTAAAEIEKKILSG
jgi:transcriptional regulatory protein LevR